MRICVKDLSGSGSKHDPLSVSYVVTGGLCYVILLWIKINPIMTHLVTSRVADTKRKWQSFTHSLIQLFQFSIVHLYLKIWTTIKIINWAIKDVRAHCYCASLVRTLYMTWLVPRHVFQARAPSRNSTKYRADGLCGNLICEYFCWMLGDPHFFFGRSLPFVILYIILKNKKKICAWEVLIISHILFK